MKVNALAWESFRECDATNIMMGCPRGDFRENFQMVSVSCTSRTNKYDSNYLLSQARVA